VTTESKISHSVVVGGTAPSSGALGDRAGAPGAPDDVAATIEAFLIDNFLLDDQDLDRDASLIESGIVDSTGAMEIVAFLEDTFAIAVDDEELVAENLDSIARLARFVASKRSSAVEGSVEAVP